MVSSAEEVPTHGVDVDTPNLGDPTAPSAMPRAESSPAAVSSRPLTSKGIRRTSALGAAVITGGILLTGVAAPGASAETSAENGPSEPAYPSEAPSATPQDQDAAAPDAPEQQPSSAPEPPADEGKGSTSSESSPSPSPEPTPPAAGEGEDRGDSGAPGEEPGSGSSGSSEASTDGGSEPSESEPSESRSPESEPSENERPESESPEGGPAEEESPDRESGDGEPGDRAPDGEEGSTPPQPSAGTPAPPEGSGEPEGGQDSQTGAQSFNLQCGYESAQAGQHVRLHVAANTGGLTIATPNPMFGTVISTGHDSLVYVAPSEFSGSATSDTFTIRATNEEGRTETASCVVGFDTSGGDAPPPELEDPAASESAEPDESPSAEPSEEPSASGPADPTPSESPGQPDGPRDETPDQDDAEDQASDKAENEDPVEDPEDLENLAQSGIDNGHAGATSLASIAAIGVGAFAVHLSRRLSSRT